MMSFLILAVRFIESWRMCHISVLTWSVKGVMQLEGTMEHANPSIHMRSH